MLAQVLECQQAEKDGKIAELESADLGEEGEDSLPVSQLGAGILLYQGNRHSIVFQSSVMKSLTMKKHSITGSKCIRNLTMVRLRDTEPHLVRRAEAVYKTLPAVIKGP